MNNELNLKFDPVVVRNRSQDELERNESIESIRKKETDLIKSNEELKKLPENSKGIEQLIKTLVSIQKEKLIYCKYEIKDKIYDRINKLREDECNLPPPVDTLSDKVEVFKSCLDVLRNRLHSLSSEFLLNEDKIKNIPTRIREQFEKSQANFQLINKKFFTDSFYDTISEIIKESLGLKLANFPDTQIFSKIIREEIIQSTKNYNILVEDIKEYLLNISNEECKNAFSNYQRLNKIIESELKILMNTAKDGANKLIKELIDIECNIQFTLNPYYMDIISKIINKIKEKKANPEINEPIVYINDIPLTQEELFSENILKGHYDTEMSVQNFQVSLFAYWKVFEKRFVDSYHMIIIHKLLNYFRYNLANEIEKKFSPSWNVQVAEMIVEDSSLNKRRKDIRVSLEALENAKEELNKIL